MKPATILLAAGLAAAPMALVPETALAFGGIGCTDLPEHDRAVGALEGMTGACDMTVERARQILARDGGAPQAVAPAGYGVQGYAPDAAPRHRRHRRRYEQR